MPAPMVAFATITAVAAVASAAAQYHAARQQKRAAELQNQLLQQQADEIRRRNEYNLKLADRKAKRESARMITKGISMGMSGTGTSLLDNVFDAYMTNEENKYWMNRDANMKARAVSYEGTSQVWTAKQKVKGALINLGIQAGAAGAGAYYGNLPEKPTT